MTWIGHARELSHVDAIRHSAAEVVKGTPLAGPKIDMVEPRIINMGRKGKPRTPNVKIPDTAPTSINGYTKHAEDQIAGRDGGIGVRRDALEDAFNHPVRTDYFSSSPNHLSFWRRHHLWTRHN